MRKLTKFLLMSGLALCLLGGAMSVTCWLLGADTNALDDRLEHRLDQLSAWNPRTDETQQSLDLEAFQNLEIDLDLGDVIITDGDEYAVQLNYWGGNYTLHHENKNGTLRIWNEGKTNLDGDGLGATVTVYLPSDKSLTDVEMTLGMGDLTWEEVPTQGKIVCNLGMGDVELSADLKGSIKAETGMGDVHVSVEEGEQAYRYDLSTGLGDLHIDGENQSQNNLKGGSGENSLTLSSGMGDMSLDFDE